MTRIHLASASPRRRELLGQLGVELTVAAADVDESERPGEGPVELVRRLARTKAEAVAATLDPSDPEWVVVGADTTVVLDGAAVGKPVDDADAAAILRRLSGRSHQVVTGVAAVSSVATTVDTAETEVHFIDLTDDDIDWYVATGEPADKAGAYGLQGIGGLFIAEVRGSVSNVIGLPLTLTRQLVTAVGGSLLGP